MRCSERCSYRCSCVDRAHRIYAAIALLSIALLMSPRWMAYAQQDDRVLTVEYFDLDTGFEITNDEGFVYKNFTEMVLSADDSLENSIGRVEFRLVRSGPIFNLDTGSRLILNELERRPDGTDLVQFDLENGTLRVVTPSVGSKAVQIDTPVSTILFEGTDAIVEYDPSTQNHRLTVERGRATFHNRLTDEMVLIPKGHYLDFYSLDFEPLPFATSQVSTLETPSVPFVVLNPQAVIIEDDEDLQKEPIAAPATVALLPYSTVPLISNLGLGESVPDDSEADAPPTEQPMPPAEAPAGILDHPIWRFLRVQAGIIPENDSIYSLIRLNPGFSVEGFELYFNISIAYENDPFFIDNWYPSSGSSEWNFGANYWEDDPKRGAVDLLRDLTLKIDYMTIGNEDSAFFFRFGSIAHITLGHGILVNDFSNTTGLPLLRRQGVYLDLNPPILGRIELLIPDVLEPEIIGGRASISLFGSLFQAGISMMVDLNPLGGLRNLPTDLTVDLFVEPGLAPDATPTESELATMAEALDHRNTFGFPAIFPVAFDLELRPIDLDTADVFAFSDIAFLLSYISPPSGLDPDNSIEDDFAADLLIDSGGDWIRNFATMTGVFTRLGFLTLRTDFRTYSGAMRPGFFDSTYLRRRVTIAAGLLELAGNPDDDRYDVFGMGIYMEGGLLLLSDRLSVGAGYYLPVEIGDSLSYSNYDSVRLWLSLEQGVLPFHLRFFYTREGVVATILQSEPFEDAHLLDGRSIYEAAIGYSPHPSFGVELFLRNMVITNSIGEIDYSEGSASTTFQFGVLARIGL